MKFSLEQLASPELVEFVSSLELDLELASSELGRFSPASPELDLELDLELASPELGKFSHSIERPPDLNSSSSNPTNVA